MRPTSELSRNTCPGDISSTHYPLHLTTKGPHSPQAWSGKGRGCGLGPMGAQRVRVCGLPCDLSGPCGGLFTPGKDLPPTRSEAALAQWKTGSQAVVPRATIEPAFPTPNPRQIQHHMAWAARLLVRLEELLGAGSQGLGPQLPVQRPSPGAPHPGSSGTSPSSSEAMEILNTLFPF